MDPPLQAAALAVLLQINDMSLFNNRKSSVVSICLTQLKLNIYFIQKLSSVSISLSSKQPYMVLKSIGSLRLVTRRLGNTSIATWKYNYGVP